MGSVKKILVLSGGRSEFGILDGVCRAIAAREELELSLAVTGVHLLPEYGSTVEQARASGIPVRFEIPFYAAQPIEDAELPASIARGVAGIDGALQEAGADLVLVLGDRPEAMAAALAGYARGIGVAHLHGGEKTDSGHVDEGFRHAITRLAHLHFAATEEAALRLRAMGEEEWRIHRVGAPGLDGIHEAARAAAEALPEEERHSPPPVVFLFHADRLAQERAGEVARGILEELRGRDLPVVAIYPNSDPGSDAIVAEIERALAAAPERLTVHRSLPRRRFLGLLARARVLVGNSSAGIIEAPALGLPAVNVGERNRRREHGANVLFVDREPGSLKRALDRALGDPSWLASLKEAPNPYGDGRAAQRIASILAEISIDEAFYRKRLTI